MTKNILLITGWGVGTAVLEDLAEQLRRQRFHVDLIDIFNPQDKIELELNIERGRHADVLIGWSLGGQLAAFLAEQVWLRTTQAKPLITLASNPCFVQRETWTKAMPEAEFLAFKQSYRDNAAACIKRFCYLISQGGQHSKKDWLTLQSLLKPQEMVCQQQGLQTLQQLNTVPILQNYVGQQFHLLAEQDQLLSHEITLDLHNLAAKFLKVIKIKGSHAFPVVESRWTCEQIVQICQQF